MASGGYSSSRENLLIRDRTYEPKGRTIVQIWEKDAKSNQHVCIKVLPGRVDAGPQDNRIKMVIPEIQNIYPDKDGNFIAAKPGSPEFDAVHTFAVIRMTFSLYEHDLLFPESFEWNVNGNHDPVTVYPHFPHEELNAYYCREKKVLVFYCAPSRRNPGKTVYACRSFDIVAHETGHAILDHLKPHWHSNGHLPQTGALHESFGDLTAMFLELSQIDEVNELISQTKGNLKSKNFIAEHAEEMGLESVRQHGLRNANNRYKLSTVGSEVHALSQVFTGAIYDILAEIFEVEKNGGSPFNYPSLLIAVAADLRVNLLLAIKTAPEANATFRDVAQGLVDSALPRHKSIMRDQFYNREILGRFSHAEIQSSSETQMRDSCCLTMRRMSERETGARENKSRRK